MLGTGYFRSKYATIQTTSDLFAIVRPRLSYSEDDHESKSQ